MHFRWSTTQEYEHCFEADDADELAEAALDAAAAARLETEKHYHEDGEGVDRVKYPSLFLHIGCEVCGDWHTCGRRNCNRAGLPLWDVVDNYGPDPAGLDTAFPHTFPQDAQIIRSCAATWWRHGIDWIDHCRNMHEGAGDTADQV